MFKASLRALRTFWRALPARSPDARGGLAWRAVFLFAALAIASSPWQMQLWVGALCLYFLPSIVANGRDHDREAIARIFVLNLLLGWTVVGWVVAMSRACARRRLSAREFFT